MDILLVNYMYERLLGRCWTSSMINHRGAIDPCLKENEEVLKAAVAPITTAAAPPPMRPIQIREVLASPSLNKFTRMRREREEEEPTKGKRARHALALVPLPLNPEELGFTVSDGGALGIKKIGKSPKKHGRP
ncbi:hypothetical protein ACLB2K_073576 [Fragaria x ananassa]